jgi:hypothetical protein
MNRQSLKSLGTASLGAGLGAGLMYLLDPTGGRRRRAMARNKAVHTYHLGSDALRRSTRDLGNRSRGLAAEVRSRLRREGETPDAVLHERVRATLGHCVANPGAIHVEAHDGHVILEGHVLAAEVDRLLREIGTLHGVQTIENRLQAHETSEGVSALQSEARPANRRALSPGQKLLAGTAGGALALASLAGVLTRGRSNGRSRPLFRRAGARTPTAEPVLRNGPPTPTERQLQP